MPTMTKHKCYRCTPYASTDPSEVRELDSITSTQSEGGDEVFFSSGYSAREIAQRKALETGAFVFVNNVSRRIKRPDLTVPVSYAVAKTPVYTVRGPDEWHDTVYRAYWRPLS